MYGFPHILLVSNQILSLNTLFFHLNHTGQRQVTQASVKYNEKVYYR